MSWDHFITWHFMELQRYVDAGIITKGQLGEIHRLRLIKLQELESDKRKGLRQEREKKDIIEALARFDGNRKKAAIALLMSERSLYRKIKQHAIS